MKRFVLVLLFPIIVLVSLIGWTRYFYLIRKWERKPIDPDLLQHRDELNGVWVEKWRRSLKK